MDIETLKENMIEGEVEQIMFDKMFMVNNRTINEQLEQLTIR